MTVFISYQQTLAHMRMTKKHPLSNSTLKWWHWGQQASMLVICLCAASHFVSHTLLTSPPLSYMGNMHNSFGCLDTTLSVIGLDGIRVVMYHFRVFLKAAPFQVDQSFLCLACTSVLDCVQANPNKLHQQVKHSKVLFNRSKQCWYEWSLFLETNSKMWVKNYFILNQCVTWFVIAIQD